MTKTTKPPAIFIDPDKITFLSVHEKELGDDLFFFAEPTASAVVTYRRDENRWQINIYDNGFGIDGEDATERQRKAVMRALPIGALDFAVGDDTGNAWAFARSCSDTTETLRRFAKRIAAKAA